MGNLVLSVLGSGGGEGDMFVPSFHGKKMEERKQWVREEEEQTMRHKVKEEGQRERERWVGNGEPRAQHCQEWRWGGGDILVASSHGKRLEEREHAFPLCPPRGCK
jgi:hypothetical protein